MIPLHRTIPRIERLPLADQIATLRGLISFEKPHSRRRKELEGLLARKVTKQLRKECRAA